VVFVAEKNKGRRINGEGREEGRSSCHKLNITDRFNRQNLNLSIILFVKIKRHRTF